jgi:hypothetical protein
MVDFTKIFDLRKYKDTQAGKKNNFVIASSSRSSYFLVFKKWQLPYTKNAIYAFIAFYINILNTK